MSVFDWVLTLEQEREEEPVVAGRKVDGSRSSPVPPGQHENQHTWTKRGRYIGFWSSSCARTRHPNVCFSHDWNFGVNFAAGHWGLYQNQPDGERKHRAGCP